MQNMHTIQGKSNIVIQDVRGSAINLARLNFYRGNILVQSVSGAQINITQCLSRSEEYRSLQERIATIQRELENTPEDRAEERYKAGEKLNELTEIESRFRADVIRLADTFASIAVDSERLRRARALFEDGKIGEADRLLNLEDLLSDQEKLRSESADLAEQDAESSKKLQANAAEFLVKAQLTELDIDRADRVRATREFYNASIESAESFENHSLYADFLFAHKLFDQARLHFERALELTENDAERAGVLDHLARVHTETNRLETAGEIFEKALALREPLAERDPDGFENALSATLAGLADWNAKNHLYEEAESLFQRSLDIQERQARNNPAAFEPEFAATLQSLARLYDRAHETDLALCIARRSLDIRERLAAGDPAVFEPALVESLALFGRLQARKGAIEETERLFTRAAALQEKLALRDPLAHEPGLADLFCEIADFQNQIEKKEQALESYRRAVAVREALARRDNQTFNPPLARTLHRYGRFVLLAEIMDTGVIYKRALHIQENRARKNPGAFEPDLAETLSTVAFIRELEEKPREAVEIQNRVLDIYERFAEKSPALFEPPLAEALNQMASFLLKSDPPRAEELLDRAVSIQERLVKRFPGAFGTEYIKTLQNLTEVYGGRKDTERLTAIQEKILEIRESLAKKDPRTFEPKLATTLYNLSGLYAQDKRDPEKSLSYAGRLIGIALERMEQHPHLRHHFENTLKIIEFLGEAPDAFVARIQKEKNENPREESRAGDTPAESPGESSTEPTGSPEPERVAVINEGPVLSPGDYRAATADVASREVAAEKAGPEKADSDAGVSVENVAGGAVDVAAFAGDEEDIRVRGISGAKVSITQYLSRSAEYRDLTARIDTLREQLAGPDAEGREERIKKNAELNDLLEIESRLRTDVAQLAETFAAARVDTERLRQARELFEQGRFREADAVLKVDDLKSEQEGLIAESKRFFRRRKENRRKLTNNAHEFLVKAQLKALDYRDPRRFENARDLFLRSFESASLYTNREAFARFLAAQRADAEAVEQFQQALELTADPWRKAGVFNNLGIVFSRNNNYAAAVAAYRKALEIEKERAGRSPEDQADYANALNNLGILHKQNFEYEEAEKLITEALKIVETLAGRDPENYDRLLGRTLSLLANLMNKSGKNAAAAPFYDQALKIQERLVSRNPEELEPELAITLVNAAFNLSMLKQFDPADEFFARALNLQQKLADKNPRAHEPELAICLEFQGLHYHFKKESNLSKETHRRSLEIRERLAGRDFAAFAPDMLISLGHLIALTIYTKELDEAEESARRMVDILERFGRDYPDLYREKFDMDLESLVDWYHDHLDEETGLPRLLALYDAMAEHHGGIIFRRGRAKGLQNMGDLHAAGERKEEARAAYARARTLFENLALENPEQFSPFLAEVQYKQSVLDGTAAPAAAGEDYEDPAHEIEVLGATQLEKGLLAEARASFEKAIRIREKISMDIQDNVLRLAQSYNRLGIVHRRRNDLDAAAKNFQRSVQTNALLAPEHPIAVFNLATAAESLANTLSAQDKLLAAEQAFNQAHDHFAMFGGADRIDNLTSMASCAFNAATAFIRAGDFAKGSFYFERSLPLYEKLAQKEPEEHEPNLADNLVYLAHAYSRQKTNEEDALNHLRRALPMFLVNMKKWEYARDGIRNARQILIALGQDPEDFIKELNPGI